MAVQKMNPEIVEEKTTQKKCSNCSEIKDIKDFYIDNRSSDGLQCGCKECHNKSNKTYRDKTKDKLRIKNKKWRDDNPEKCLEYSRRNNENNKEKNNEKSKRWSKNNPEKVRKAHKEYRKNNRDKVNKYKREWYKKNSEKILEIQRIWRMNNKEIKRERDRSWRKRNPEKVNYISSVKRARKLNAEGSHTLEEWLKLKLKYNYTCPACGKREPEIKLTKDHIIPLTKNGTDYIENIQPLCFSCNSVKNNKLITIEELNHYICQQIN